MCQVIVLFVIAVPRLVEHRWNVARTVRLPEAQRVLNVAVVLDAAVLAHLHVVDADVCMQVVAVATIVAIERTAEHAVWLSIVITDAITVVYLETQAGNLVDVRCEVCPDAVLPVLAVAALVVGQVGDGT